MKLRKGDTVQVITGKDKGKQGEIDMVFHSGDISYANGYLSGWDFFLDMVSPISGMF